VLKLADALVGAVIKLNHEIGHFEQGRELTLDNRL